MIAFFATPIGRWLVMAMLVAAAMAWAYTKGISRESDRRDALALEQERIEHARYAASVKVGMNAAGELQVADAAALEYHDKWRVANEKLKRTGTPLVVGACPGSKPAQPVPVGGSRLADPSSPGGIDLRLTWAFIGVYDGAWTGRDGQPVQGNTAGPAPAPERAGAASPYGPAELLAAHGENAARCSADRRMTHQLLDVIDKLEAKWDREHK